MKRIEKLYAEWQSLQPIQEDIQATIDQKFMLEFNYNSNHIEGNTLTYGQTELLLMFGQVDGDAKMHDLEEMKAHNVGLKMMQEEALATERHLSEYFIKTLHKTLIREDYNVRKELPDGSVATYTVHAGQYKSRPNSVITATGERFEYASPEETPALMTDLVDWYNSEVAEKKLSALELASLFHYRYIRIHPFEDGNGRIARLLVNFILLRAGYPMIVVRTKEKDKYLSALYRSDIAVGLTPSEGAHAELEQILPFIEYMKGCLERALDIRIRAAKGESIEEKDDWKKRISVLSQRAKSKPARTTKLMRQALLDSFIPLVKTVDDAIRQFAEVFFSIESGIASNFSDINFRNGIESFENFTKQGNTYKKPAYISNIKITQFINAYDFDIIIQCVFDEFGFEFQSNIGGVQGQTISLRYNQTITPQQIDDVVRCIGEQAAIQYEIFINENMQ